MGSDRQQNALGDAQLLEVRYLGVHPLGLATKACPFIWAFLRAQDSVVSSHVEGKIGLVTLLWHADRA